MRSQLFLFALLAACAAAWVGCPANDNTAPQQTENMVQELVNTTIEETPVVLPSAAAPVAENKTAGSLYLSALAQFNRKDYKAALVEIEKCLQEFPSYVDAWYLKGNCLSEMGNPKDAVEAYKKVVELDKAHFDARYNLGQAYIDAKDYKNAVTTLRELSKDRRAPSYIMAYGRALVLDGDYAKAEEILKISINDFPDDPVAHRYYADALLHNHKFGDAATAYEAYLKMDPQDDGARFNHALSLEGAKKPDEALVEYQKVIEINPRFADAYRNIGAIYAARKENAAAIQALENYLRLAPDTEDAAKIRKELAAANSGGSGSTPDEGGAPPSEAPSTGEPQG